MNTEPLDVWDAVLEDVLRMLVKEGVQRVTMELLGEPDAWGHVRVKITPTAKAEPKGKP